MIPKPVERQERVIAGLLSYGSWIATGIITLGLVSGLSHLEMISPTVVSGTGLVKSGIALFIALPIARVGLMFVMFLRERDYTYAAISALVLAIIAAGILVELWSLSGQSARPE
jgi:uncharacterized membrane protein